MLMMTNMMQQCWYYGDADVLDGSTCDGPTIGFVMVSELAMVRKMMRL